MCAVAGRLFGFAGKTLQCRQHFQIFFGQPDHLGLGLLQLLRQPAQAASDDLHDQVKGGYQQGYQQRQQRINAQHQDACAKHRKQQRRDADQGATEETAQAGHLVGHQRQGVALPVRLMVGQWQALQVVIDALTQVCQQPRRDAAGEIGDDNFQQGDQHQRQQQPADQRTESLTLVTDDAAEHLPGQPWHGERHCRTGEHQHCNQCEVPTVGGGIGEQVTQLHG